MTRIKTILKNVEILNVKEVTSKRGNKYNIVTVNHENNEIGLYDPSNLNYEIGSFYDLELEVVTSRTSGSLKILNCYKIKQDEKKGFFK